MNSVSVSSRLSMLEVIREELREQYRDHQAEELKSRKLSEVIIGLTPEFLRKIVFVRAFNNDPLKLQAIAIRQSQRHRKVG